MVQIWSISGTPIRPLLIRWSIIRFQNSIEDLLEDIYTISGFLFFIFLFFLGIHTMQGWTATVRQELQEKEPQKDYSIQELCLERIYG